MENRFNLIDEPWIPIAGYGRASLREVFSPNQFHFLGGNPVQKIAVLKLLLAIAQAAATPKDEEEWQALGTEGLAAKCLAYLEKWHDRFYLYGDKPFLQMPAIEKLINERTERCLKAAKTAGKKQEAEASGIPKGFGAGVYPDLPSENNTFFSFTLAEQSLNEAEQAVFLVTLMNFAFGGKRTESDLKTLDGQILGSQYSAKAGVSLGGFEGYLHSFVLSGSIIQDVWFNLLTEENIFKFNMWPEGIGKPLWEQLPESESCNRATSYKQSYLASLVAFCRFTLLKEKGIFYMDGLSYPTIKEGWFEPSLILNRTGKEIKARYTNPEKKPWRELESLLSFVSSGSNQGFVSEGLKMSITRLKMAKIENMHIWVGGIKVSVNSGDQSVKQSDDFAESLIYIPTKILGENWFNQFKIEMEALEQLSSRIWVATIGYFKTLKADNGKDINNTHAGKMAKQAQSLFWQLCERNFQELVNNCEYTEEQNLARQKLRKIFAAYQHQAFDTFCPNETARQIDAWAKNRPNNYKYTHQEA